MARAPAQFDDAHTSAARRCAKPAASYRFRELAGLLQPPRVSSGQAPAAGGSVVPSVRLSYLLAGLSAIALTVGSAEGAPFTVPPDITTGQAMAAGDTLTVNPGGSVTNTSGNDAVSGTGATSISNAG